MITIYKIIDGEIVEKQVTPVTLDRELRNGWSVEKPELERDKNEGGGGAFDFDFSTFEMFTGESIYQGIPNVIENPRWYEGTTREGEKALIAPNVLFPDMELHPSYGATTYLTGPKWNPVNIGGFQDLLVDAGYLGEDDYNEGQNDLSTQSAIRKWFADINNVNLDSYLNGNNVDIDPIKFLGQQVNRRFQKLVSEIDEQTKEYAESIDRGAFLRDNMEAVIGRNPTDNELKKFQKMANEFINKELEASKQRAIFELKDEFGKLPEFDEATTKLQEKGITMEGEEVGTFLKKYGVSRDPIKPDEFNSTEAFQNKIRELYKTYIERADRGERADFNFQNVNASIMGGPMATGRN